MPNTVVFGVTFVDVKGHPNSAYDPKGRNLGSVKIVHGGVSRNVVENFANAGMPVSFASILEDSAFGRDVERKLLNAGADLSYVVTVSENGLGMWLVILNEHGDMAGSISCMPDISQIERLVNEKGDKIISGAANVVLEIDMDEKIASRILDLAEKYDKKVYTIVGNMSVILAHKEYLKRTDCFICNEIEAGKLFDSDIRDYSPGEMMDFLPAAADGLEIKKMVVTMGDRGSVYYDKVAGELGICPIFNARVVDTSGAGDAFFSGTVMGLTRGLALSEAVQYGSRLAAMTIESEESACPPCPDFFNEQMSLFDE